MKRSSPDAVTPTSDFKNRTNWSLNFFVLKFLFQKVFIRRGYQYNSGSNTVVFEKAGPRDLGSSGQFCTDRKESAFSLGQRSVTCMLGAGAMTQNAATLSHMRQLVPCQSPGSAWGRGIHGDLKCRWGTT